MSELVNKLNLKLRKTWLKMLKAYSKGKTEKARKLEAKVIKLELGLKKA